MNQAKTGSGNSAPKGQNAGNGQHGQSHGNTRGIPATEISKKESKLDQWIRQTLKLGNQDPASQIVHEEGLKGPSAPGNKTANQPAEKTYEGKKAFFKRMRDQRKEKHLHKKEERQVSGIRMAAARGGVTHFHGKLRIIPIGGLNEVGKNCMALEYGHEIIIIDLGFQFPDEDMLGVDYVIPDTSYLNDKLDRIKGVFFTHGHLDHIGAVPYLIPRLNYPDMYGTRLTMGLVQKRLEEFGLVEKSKLREIKPNEIIRLGSFTVIPYSINHSIPDAVGYFVQTPAGNLIHTGDFKFDFTPSGDQKPADFASIASLSGQNIGALFIESTNAQKPGTTISEKVIGDSLESIFKEIRGRIIIASFASQIGRMQSIVDLAQKYNKKIFLSGRSLIDNIYIAKKLGYMRVPEGLIHDIRKSHKIPDEDTVILTTGSQGEDVSALTRMASEEHPVIKIKKGDTVILSSSPIPGNERAVNTVTNNLSRLGARIINNDIMDVHASGHAKQEELKLMMSLVRAKYVVPVHGEYFMRYNNAELAHSLGYSEKNTILAENGFVMEMENNELKLTKERIQNNYVLVDGLGVGDIGAQVIMDRQTMAENGVLIVMIYVDEKSKKIKGEIEVISRGFVYMKQSEEIIAVIKTATEGAYRTVIEKRPDAKRGEIKKYISENLDKIIHQKIERHPLILPIVVEA